jgi:hypothetical protein
MPGAVIAAALLIVLLFAQVTIGAWMIQETPATTYLLSSLVTGSLLAGLLFRRSIAWSLSRTLAAIMPFIAVGFLVFTCRSYTPTTIAASAMAVLPTVGLNIAVFLLLDRPTSRAWFGLGCPRCGNLYPFSVKFGHSLARCRECHCLFEPSTGAIPGSLHDRGGQL